MVHRLRLSMPAVYMAANARGGDRVMGAARPTRGRPRRRLIACALALLPVAAALADAEENARAEPELSRVQATEIVQKRYGARVVRASDTDEGGRHI